MVHPQEASRQDLTVRLIAAAARDHGPAVFILGASPEELLIADVIVRHRLPVDLVAVGPEADVLGAYVRRLYCLDGEGVRAVATLDDALFGKNARITGARATGGLTVPAYEYDALAGMLRFNPVAAWTDAEVRAYLEAAGIGHFASAPQSRRERADARGVTA